MNKFNRFLLLFPALLLSACGGTLSIALDTTPTPDHAPGATVQALEAQIATLQPQNAGLDMQAGSETIRQALLNSHKNWQTVWLDGQIVTSTPQGGSEKVRPQSLRAQVWVDRAAAKFRVLTGPLEGSPQMLQISDGVTQARTNLENDTTQAQPLMDGAHVLNWQAPQAAQDAESVVPHPLDLEIDSPLGEMVFPAALAQQRGTFTPTGMEKIAGRLAFIVETWDAAQMRARLWIDTESGILLRWDAYGKEGLSNSPDSSIVINALALDGAFPADLFDLRLKEKPQFALDASGAVNATPQPPEADFGRNDGELYFVIDRSPEALQLARLPGGCVDGSSPCPAAQIVEGFPNKNNTIQPLIWSPDMRWAALVQQGLLYRFDPESADWKEIAQFPVLREGAAWSADSERLAFIGQQQDDRQDIYAVGPDGSGLQNLTNGQFQGADVSLWVDGFLADGRLLFEVIERTSAQPHTLQPRAAEGAGLEAKPIPGLTLQHGILTIAPDRQQIAYTNSQDGTTTLNVTGLDLTGESVLTRGEPRRLATFQQATIHEILWSAVTETAPEPSAAPTADASTEPSAANAQWIAFIVSSGSTPENNVNTVYVIRPDGTDLRQLFQSGSIHRLSFAGNGRYLIAALADNNRLSVIPLDGGAAHPLEAPGLRLDQPILGVSWRGR